MTARIYLDHAASTPLRPEALEAMLPYLQARGFNASSLHAEGRAARDAVDAARERVAGVLGAKPKEIVFTSGGSEADNLAVLGVAATRPQGAHLISTAIEHSAVLAAFERLRSEHVRTTLLTVDSEGRLDRQRFADAMSDGTMLASVMYVNNELGTIAPIGELARIARANGVLFHTDAVQAAAYLPLDVNALGVDLMSISAHKFQGPKGAGVLYVREGTPIQPLLLGGSQEYARRAGTENVAAIAGMARALELAAGEREGNARIAGGLRDRFEAAVTARISDVRINGAGAGRAPHISHLSFRGVTSEQLLLRLDLDGLAVSAGSACASGALGPSHVVGALGLAPEWSSGVARFSFGPRMTADEIDAAVEVLGRAVADLRSISRA